MFSTFLHFQRSEQKLKPFVIFFGVFTVLAFLGLFNLTLSALIEFIVTLYSFATIYSLRKKLQEEDEAAAQPQSFPVTIDTIDMGNMA